MELHNVTQGSAEWLALRTQYFTASEAPAMMGASSYMTRSELMAQKHTGLVAEVDAATQRRFDAGHETEAAFRPVAEEIIGDELYPCTGSVVVDGLRLLASFDGLTMDRKVGMEHKLFNVTIADFIDQFGEPGPAYYWQMEQQLLVSGAEKILFATSNGTKENMVTCWYESKPERRAALIAGWKQFAEDLKAYVPTEFVEVKPIVSQRPEQLPALRHEVTGTLVLTSNIKEWEEAARAYIKQVRDHELKTDEDFTAADEAKDWCETTKTKLTGMKTSLMSSTGGVNEAVEALDRIMADLDSTRISFANAIKARKDARKADIVADGVAKFKAHIDALNTRLGKPYMPTIAADFGAAIKGKSSLSKMEDAVATTLANAKIAANEAADRLQKNLDYLRDNAADFKFLFADTATIIQKAPDDLQALVQNRINEHKAEEAAKEERIHKEEQDRLAKQQADAAIAAAAQATAATPAPAPVATAPVVAQSVASTPVVAQKPAAVIDNGARIKLGEICERLGFNVTAEFLAGLGFAATVERNAKLYRESDWPAICEALIQHITQVADLQAA